MVKLSYSARNAKLFEYFRPSSSFPPIFCTLFFPSYFNFFLFIPIYILSFRVLLLCPHVRLLSLCCFSLPLLEWISFFRATTQFYVTTNSGNVYICGRWCSFISDYTGGKKYIQRFFGKALQQMWQTYGAYASCQTSLLQGVCFNVKTVLTAHLTGFVWHILCSWTAERSVTTRQLQD